MSTFAGRNEAFVQRREEKLRRAAEEETRGLYRPAVNPVSESIVSSLPTSTMERLTTPSARSRTPTRLSAPNSVARAQTPPSRHTPVQGDLRRRSWQRPAESFVWKCPERNKMHENCRSAVSTANHDTITLPPRHQFVYVRSNEAMGQQRDDRLEQARAAEAEQQEQAGHYTPVRSNPPLQGTNTDLNAIAGFNEFVQRQATGRNQQADNRNPVSPVPGSSVRRTPTVADGPVLGRDRSAQPTVLSLARPVNPPPLGASSPTGTERRTDLTPLAQHLFRQAATTELDDDEY